METCDETRLRELALSFRNAILRTKKDRLPSSLRDFPLGSCGDACLLLARFLKDHGFGDATYIWGRRGPYSHAWLEFEGFQVDITADQFVSDPENKLWIGSPQEIKDGVIVTADKSWHELFDSRSATKVFRWGVSHHCDV